jgi:hypothetical protein
MFQSLNRMENRATSEVSGCVIRVLISVSSKYSSFHFVALCSLSKMNAENAVSWDVTSCDPV